MTLGKTIALFRLHLVNADFGTLAVFYNACCNCCTLKQWGTELAAILVDNCKNAVKGNSIAALDIQLLDEDDVALGNTLLLSAGFDYSVFHLSLSPLSKSRF